MKRTPSSDFLRATVLLHWDAKDMTTRIRVTIINAWRKNRDGLTSKVS